MNGFAGLIQLLSGWIILQGFGVKSVRRENLFLRQPQEFVF